MARLILAASAGWEEDAQTAREAAAELAALAGPAANNSAGKVRMAAASAFLGFTFPLRAARSGRRQAADPIVNA
jgi:hypothetical protein